ncbi:MAG: zf-HC2 domain-containing protein [Acidobacteriota bacterium]
MDHSYIDRNDIAGQYLRKELDEGDRVTFQAHLVDCQECADRVLLAEMFLPKEPPAPPPATPEPVIRERMPMRARIVAYLTPWQIAGILVLAVLILLTVPAALFWWELANFRSPR